VNAETPIHSYLEFFDRVIPQASDPFEAWEMFSDDFAHRQEGVHKYRHAFAEEQAQFGAGFTMSHLPLPPLCIPRVS